MNVGVPTSSVTLCCSQSLPIVRASERVEVVDDLLAQTPAPSRS